MSYATCSWFFFPVTVAESAFKELFLWAPSSKHASQVFTVACDRTRAFRRPPGIRGIQEPKRKPRHLQWLLWCELQGYVRFWFWPIPRQKKPWCFRAGAGPSTCRGTTGSPGGCGCGGATAPQEVPDCDCYAYPLVMTNSLLLKMAHRNLDLWIYLVKMVIFHSYVNVYQRVYVDKYD